MRTAEQLKIKGLCDVSERHEFNDNNTPKRGRIKRSRSSDQEIVYQMVRNDQQSTIIGGNGEIDSSPQKISKDDHHQHHHHHRDSKNGSPTLVLLEQRVTGGSSASGGSETDVGGDGKDRNLTSSLGVVRFFVFFSKIKGSKKFFCKKIK